MNKKIKEPEAIPDFARMCSAGVSPASSPGVPPGGHTVHADENRYRKGALASTPGGVEKVRFQRSAPEAKSVGVAGTFNDWQVDATSLQQQADGLWTVALPLSPGTYEYLFVMDGCWRPDPNAAETSPNPFGTRNSVLRVSAMT